MKKIITFIFIFVMITLSASADYGPDFVGAWSTLRDLDDKLSEIVTLRVFPDQKAFYSRSKFSEGEIFEEEKGIYTWEQTGDLSFKLFRDSGEVIDEYGLLSEKRLLSTKSMFARVDFYARDTVTPEPAPTPVPLNNLETGYLLDPGQYIVGEDLPAGNYRFEYYENPCDIFVHKNPDSALWSAYASVSKKSPVYAKLNLPKGARLDINAYPVIIMYAKSLNLGE